MPELPEVETIKRGLADKLPGLVIKKIEVLNPKSFQGNLKEVEGKKVVSVGRRGKMLVFELTAVRSDLAASKKVEVGTSNVPAALESGSSRKAESTFLVFHLKMSGQVIFAQWPHSKFKSQGTFAGGHPTKDMRGQMPNRSTRAIFTLGNGSKLYFNDQRKFGWIKISDKLFESLGPEPLKEGFTQELLKANLLKHKNTPVKVAIMDQTVVAGVGNIYAAEALFLSGIHPKRKACQLDDKELQDLFRGIQQALYAGIKHQGSSRSHFVDSDGRKGSFLNFAYVYNREGLPCKVCQKRISKITLNGRGTYFCPNCQR